MLDYNEAEAEHLPVEALAHPDDLPRILAHFQSVPTLKAGEYAEIEYRMIHKDGGWRWFHCRDTVSGRDSAGAAIQMMGTVQDVTRRREAEIALHQANHELSALISQAPLAIYTLGADGRVLSWNPAAEKMFGWTAAEVVGRMLPVVPPEETDRFHVQLQAAIRGDIPTSVEEKALRRDGSLIDIRLSSAPLRSYGGTPDALTIIAADITAERRTQAELQEAVRQLAVLAATDGLTGLTNHRVFQDKLAEACAHAERYDTAPALLLLDVDSFKQYNDSFGHPAGDEVLRRVAGVIRRSIRSTDTAARYGGEEFAVILPDTADAGRVAEHVRREVAAEEWPLRPVTVSLGVGVWQCGLSASALIKRSDTALYASKQQGRNQVTVWGPALSGALQAEDEIRHETTTLR